MLELEIKWFEMQNIRWLIEKYRMYIDSCFDVLYNGKDFVRWKYYDCK